MEKLKKEGKMNGRPKVLIICPTRELAQQVSSVADTVKSHVNFKTACFFGGSSAQANRIALSNGLDMVVGTPGRLNQMVEEGHLVLSECGLIILDEVRFFES